MGKFSKVLIVSDMDDTLLDKDKKIPQSNIDAIDYFTKNGGYFIIATGRSWSNTKYVWEQISGNGPVICQNGAVIVDSKTDEILKAYPVDDDFADVVRDVTAKFPEIATLIQTIAQRSYIYRANIQSKTYNSKKMTHEKYIDAELEDITPLWMKGVLFAENSVLKKAQVYIENTYPNLETNFSNEILLEVQKKGVNKGSSVYEVSRMLGIDECDVYCAGDQYNDKSMVERFNGCVPRGSEEGMIEIADYILDDCNEGAIASLISILDEKY